MHKTGNRDKAEHRPGNHILARAAGESAYKLDHAHRGANQTVQDLLARRCYITSQNHGYAVDENSLSKVWETWIVNINDGTNERIRSMANWFALGKLTVFAW